MSDDAYHENIAKCYPTITRRMVKLIQVQRERRPYGHETVSIKPNSIVFSPCFLFTSPACFAIILAAVPAICLRRLSGFPSASVAPARRKSLTASISVAHCTMTAYANMSNHFRPGADRRTAHFSFHGKIITTKTRAISSTRFPHLTADRRKASTT